MSAIIEIKKELIGTENVNSVNSRELWSNLEVKKKFADWIKVQINTLGLDENIDYLTVPLKGNGGKFSGTDYIITLDTAKHIAMASRTQKGKEVRKYFIEAEKQLKNISPVSSEMVLAEIVKSNQEMIKTNQAVVENLTEMNKGLHQMLVGLVNMQHDVKSIKKKVDYDLVGGINIWGSQIKRIRENQEVLHPNNIDLIRETINDRAKALSKDEREIQSITRAIYSYINNEFGVSSYYHIKDKDLTQVLSIIENLNIGVQND